MTKETQVYHVCDRPHSSEVEAVATNRFSLNGERFKIDLCDECAEQLRDLVMGWAADGTSDGTTQFERALSLRPVTLKRPAAKPDPRPAPAPEPEPVIVVAKARGEVPATAARWTISEHAQGRMTLREFSNSEVLLACERPEVVRETPTGGQLRRRGRCDAIVDPQTCTVLTVQIAGETKATWQEALTQKGA